MKINTINPTVTTMNTRMHQVVNKGTIQNVDTVSFTISPTSKSTSAQKNYGELFAEYLDSVGYYDSMSAEAKDELINEIKNNVYSFGVDKASNVYDSYFKITDSVAYLKSLASNVASVDLRQEFTQLINTYKKNSYHAITDYTNQLLLDEANAAQQESLKLLQEKMAETSMLLQQLESAKKQADAMEESFEVIANCMKIAMRILNGDEVPAKDAQYLMENDPDLYEMAVSMRQENDDPKRYDSVLEDEEESASDDMAISSENPELSDIVDGAASSGEIQGGE
ncbi:MAG: hypothetical protein IKM20_03620 [Erysipelotrichales bacterium]|nr:hypothetical protein [Erysipelotrichales bacterium]